MTQPRELGITEYAEALANADRQYAHAIAALNENVIGRARDLTTVVGSTIAWSILSSELYTKLNDDPKYVQFMAEMLAAAVVREVASDAPDDALSDAPEIPPGIREADVWDLESGTRDEPQGV